MSGQRQCAGIRWQVGALARGEETTLWGVRRRCSRRIRLYPARLAHLLDLRFIFAICSPLPDLGEYMANIARASLESALRARKLDRTLTTVLPPLERRDETTVVPVDVTAIDACLQGGVPRGQLSEIAGASSSEIGRAHV